ncbi:hypothetical protein [Leptospira interrogans]|uniref:hypothetical protein n=1 Tax=Leptospira interrogans TaxID=173 RepID=UPI00077421C4|nr:hypothetical protein [Leptospira interrogans]OQM31004.1 hypothetical protein DV38_08310 [Leptospira interrogans]
MNTSEYQRGFQDLYSEIYRDYYQFEENVLLHSRNFMMRNLNAFGLNQATTSEGVGLRILNIGTGREVINFHKLGASKIFHFDLSELAIVAISNYIQKNNIKNIITERKDRYMYFGRFISDRAHRFGIYAWYNQSSKGCKSSIYEYTYEFE